ncbi:hypothetical protein H0H92_002614, partial [Tricholoma furcatifolium]
GAPGTRVSTLQLVNAALARLRDPSTGRFTPGVQTPTIPITPPNSVAHASPTSTPSLNTSPWTEANSIYRTPTAVPDDESATESTIDDLTFTPSTPTTPPRAPVHTPRTYTAMPDLDLQPFHGDRDDESPRDFINSIKKFFMFGRGQEESDADKIEYFSFSLKDGGAAATWFANLAPDRKQTWAGLLAAFDERWPGTQATEKTQSEKQDELMEMKLTEEDLGKKVVVKGVEVYSHVAWADKVERAAKTIPDTNNLLVKSTRLNMPSTLRALVPASKSTWKTFCDAVRAVDIADMKEMKEEKQRTRKLEDEIRDLKAKAATPPTPSKALAATLSKVQLGAPIPAPVFTPKPAANPGPQTPAQTTQAPARTDADKWAMIQRMARPDPASDASRAAYRTAINQWHAANPRSYAAHEDRPYPLTPGTAPLGSGECTGCGYTGHIENACTAAARIPQIESRWRRKVDSIRRAVNAPVVAVNLVDATDVLPPGITPEQLRAIIDAYLADRNDQGKAEGSSD